MDGRLWETVYQAPTHLAPVVIARGGVTAWMTRHLVSDRELAHNALLRFDMKINSLGGSFIKEWSASEGEELQETI